jgi:hypothetical protein
LGPLTVNTGKTPSAVMPRACGALRRLAEGAVLGDVLDALALDEHLSSII